MRHKRHPLSAIFGDMAEPALLALADDIKEKGILEPVVLYDGQVLDGWHRCLAGQIAEVEIPYTEYTGDDPGGFVISKNLHRRQKPLTASQRAALVLKIHEWRPVGRPGNSVPVRNYSARELAAEAEVSESTIEHAKRAQRAGLGEQVANGSVSAKAAASKARNESNGAAPTPPKKSPLDKARERIAELEAELSEEREKKNALADEVQAQLDASAEPSEQEVKFKQLYERIRVLESQVGEHQHRANMFMRECAALKKRFGVK